MCYSTVIVCQGFYDYFFYRIWNGLCVYNLLLKQQLRRICLLSPQEYLYIAFSSANVAGVNGHIRSWEVPVPVNEYFTGQWSRFCGLDSKTSNYQAFLWKNDYSPVVLLNFCSSNIY